jgi:hypothetical protein
MPRSYSFTFVPLILVIASCIIHAGEADRKSHLDLTSLRTKVVWDLSQLNLKEDYQWPFCREQTNRQLQETCLESLQVLNSQLQRINEWLRSCRHTHEVLKSERSTDDNVLLLADCFLYFADITHDNYKKAILIIEEMYRKIAPRTNVHIQSSGHLTACSIVKKPRRYTM